MNSWFGARRLDQSELLAVKAMWAKPLVNYPVQFPHGKGQFFSSSIWLCSLFVCLIASLHQSERWRGNPHFRVNYFTLSSFWNLVVDALRKTVTLSSLMSGAFQSTSLRKFSKWPPSPPPSRAIRCCYSAKCSLRDQDKNISRKLKQLIIDLNVQSGIKPITQFAMIRSRPFDYRESWPCIAVDRIEGP